LKFSLGLGAVVIVLITIVLALLGIVSLFGAFCAFLLMLGVWCIIGAFALVGKNNRYYYLGWGLILASLSTIYFIPWQYSVAIALILIIILIIASRIRP
jgi:uncharacterized membrane protein HdeD (DUF308 family)